ncbi:hypothetical protein E5E91_10750 [Deinococcus radiodurans R1 = ATCC 13939 = DSM 20539]|uniref:Uncharacterized protein n=1 Tax=Deinococcus radiodurans (strain ATCC 13939 / DSM 20539 / JCM 16871 / CCUG 27074 / LMG 4051 / NBRC 15346 / NCIMB 9279 / VKM B-1422 / R1) TaxID=243230 RepID=Q9RSP2_DEIRA|nr:hypothetical protein DR_2082 [Deinococcus radiodurans R1 = ATCC 13939 = DSM 20539]QEM71471.1 hypothetical protein DXG80_06665 [Deinococcus radiodurans]UDL01119.1 hypothetical protein E5E91_10750 [Deinococcus radiodurans R1 = ATCC 13939 = DSM 20539]HCE63888.1 hypothetical protein [Deinococcus radiodurans]
MVLLDMNMKKPGLAAWTAKRLKTATGVLRRSEFACSVRAWRDFGGPRGASPDRSDGRGASWPHNSAAGGQGSKRLPSLPGSMATFAPPGPYAQICPPRPPLNWRRCVSPRRSGGRCWSQCLC